MTSATEPARLEPQLQPVPVQRRITPGRAFSMAPGAQLVQPPSAGRWAAAQLKSRPYRSVPVVPRAQLVDPGAPGKRLVVTPQQLNPSKLEDMRKAESFGPRGLLLIGMSERDCQAVQCWFQQMDPQFVVSCCPSALLASGTLRQALEGDGSNGASLPEWPWEQQPADAPPVAFFSGMSGEEQVALMEGWTEHTGLQAPAFASVTSTILDKQLRSLLADIMRAQAQQPPPGFDPEQVAAVQVAANSSSAAAAAAVAAGGEGGEQTLRSKLQDYVMLNDGQQQASPMSLDALKEQIQEKMRQKKAQAAAAERQARKEANQDETDQLRQALQGGKKRQGGKKNGAGGSSAKKGFGS